MDYVDGSMSAYKGVCEVDAHRRQTVRSLAVYMLTPAS